MKVTLTDIKVTDLQLKEFREEFVDQIVDVGLRTVDPRIFEDLIVDALREDKGDLAYEIAHSILDFEIETPPRVLEALRPFLRNPSRRVVMAVLMVFLKTKGLPACRDIIEGLPQEWQPIAESLANRLTPYSLCK